MKKKLMGIAGLFFAACLILAGCGGNNNDNSVLLTGFVADGYLQGAKVCLDKNNNKQCDSNEPSVMTNAQGAYSLRVDTTDAGLYPVFVEVSIGVVDSDRGPVSSPYFLSAPVGKHAFISPLTTLAQYLVENGDPIEQAESKLKAELGFTHSLFTDYKPGVNTATDEQKWIASVARKIADALADALATYNDRKNTLQQVMDQLTIIVVGKPNFVAPSPSPSATITLPKTGQTTSYVAGDDGALQKGEAWPNPRFSDNNNGTVTDNLTGLIWLKNANCFGAKSWADALTSANSLASGACGLTDGSAAGDWRLPNIVELESLVDLEQYNPALPAEHPFTGVQSGYYWSSSSYAGDRPSNAWGMFPSFGGVDYVGKGDAFYVCREWEQRW